VLSSEVDIGSPEENASKSKWSLFRSRKGIGSGSQGVGNTERSTPLEAAGPGFAVFGARSFHELSRPNTCAVTPFGRTVDSNHGPFFQERDRI
jgi:hypothetical protein